ncbi:MAG: MotA/TolQ/ExbB proton channel family protein [Planctomycetota bacterium]|nr:MotA/TolQ/ExbB proton channel family protein [Planctomycetota bacterium]
MSEYQSSNDSTSTALTGVHVVRIKTKSVTGLGIILGIIGTVVFYNVAPMIARHFSGGPEFVQRYFCGHPLEYVTSGLFFVGMGILAVKWKQLPTERAVITNVQGLATTADWTQDDSTSGAVQKLNAWQANSKYASWRSTSMWHRVEDVLHYVNAGKNGGVEGHLKYLADLSVDRLIQSYSLIRTVTWAVPIMGFLGTVIGITMAIANVTPEQLDSSLPEVTAGLAVAFDTTAQALTMSMLLVFATFLVERNEQAILNDVEQFGIDSLIPFVRTAETQAAEPLSGLPALATWTAEILSQQTDSWQRHLAAMQSGWAETLAGQTDSLAQALTDETAATLKSHRDTSDAARDQYAATLHQSSQIFVQQMQQSMMTFTDRVDLWQNAMRESSLASAGQAEELHRLGRTMLQLTEAEQKLVQIQESLNENLQTLQMVATLEQTVQSLNAAVSILTSKTSMRVAA